MSARVDTASLISGACVVGTRGLGVLGSQVPTTGDHGAGYIYNDLTLPADANKEVRGLIVTPPASGTFLAYEDSSFTLAAADGQYTFTYRLFEDGVDKGLGTVTVNIGSSTVTADFAGSYVVIGAAQASFAGNYSVSSAVQADSSGSFSVLSAVQTDFAGGYDVLPGYAQADYSGSYSVLSAVQADVSGSYSVAGVVQADFVGSYTVSLVDAVTADFAGAYVVIGSAQRDFPGSYKILSANTYVDMPSVRIAAPQRMRVYLPRGQQSVQPDVVFTPKYIAEEEVFGIKFASIMSKDDAIRTASVTISRVSGHGSTAGMLKGTPVIQGTDVQQLIVGGTRGAVYHVRFTVLTELGQKLAIVGELAICD